MKKLLLALLLTSCAHQKSLDEQVDEIKYELTVKHINELRGDVRRLDYYINHEKCFISYAICLGEKKFGQRDCWDKHEACVIRVYKQWMGK